MTDEERLQVVEEIYAECDAGLRWAPLYIALQRYEKRVRERLRNDKTQVDQG